MSNMAVYILKCFNAIKLQVVSGLGLMGLWSHKNFHVNCQERKTHAVLMFLSPQFYGLPKSQRVICQA